MTKFTRLSLSALIMLLVSVVLAGCSTSTPTNTATTSPTTSPPQGGTSMTPEKSLEEFKPLVNAMEELVPGKWDFDTDWETDPENYVKPCSFDSPNTGDERKQFSFTNRRGDLSKEEMDALHDKYKALFESKSYEITQQQDGGNKGNLYTTGWGPDKSRASVTSTPGQLSISALSRCFDDPDNKYR